MAKSKDHPSRPRKPAPPSFRVRKETLQTGDPLIASGKHWPLQGILFRMGKNSLRPQRLLEGTHWNQYIVPNAAGSFLVEFFTTALAPGQYVLEAFTRDEKLLLKERVIIEKRPQPGKETSRSKLNKKALRMDAFNNRRFDATTGLTKGLVHAAYADWKNIHDNYPKGTGDAVFFSAPVPGGCNWTPMGPAPFSDNRLSAAGNNSGRIRAIAIHPVNHSIMFIGAATGGVWKSEDAGLTWVPKTDDKFSLAIGALVIDPVNPNTIYAGTGEYVPGFVNYYYYGNGLLKSTDAGDTWNEIGVTEFTMAEISRILIDPMNTNKLYISASNGIWESTTAGTSWKKLSPDPATDLVLVRDPDVAGAVTLLAGFSDLGVYAASNTGTGWSVFEDLKIAEAPVGPMRIVFGVCRTQPEFIYAAFSEPMGGVNLGRVMSSIDSGKSWNSCSMPPGGNLSAAFYNLVILPHPSDPKIVLLGVGEPYLSIDSGVSWNPVQSTKGQKVHSDCHAIAYSLSNPDGVYLGGDGGLYYSPDLTNTWEGRNQDLATMQLYDFGQHPQYDAIMVAGSQDNGGFFYSGAPIWYRSWVSGNTPHESMEGDVVVATIDPFNGYFYYYGTAVEHYLSRSENAGRIYPKLLKVPEGAAWWIPFFPDPRTEGVLYSGGFMLSRSADHGDTWNDITIFFPGIIRAIGFHPTDPLVLYAGTILGKIFRVQGPPADPWNPETVIRTDVTYTGLPFEKQISSIAVDPSGTVWVSFSTLQPGSDPGEFSNQHVFRLDAGAEAWVERSNGLAIANPVNALVIDPEDATKVYCGADRGVYRWNAGGENWTLLDQGLPNAPVLLLKIHAPSRKLRAATFGRGMWERNLDPGNCSDHFLYMRSHIADAGSEPAADGVPHPYLPGHLCWHWQSPDIIVDPSHENDPSQIQTELPVTSAIELYDKVVHYGGRRGTNRVYITVHNKGPFRVTNVLVRVFFAIASGVLPPFPKNLLEETFTWTPSEPVDWNPIGAAFSIPSIEPGTTRLAVWPDVVIPEDAPPHCCLMAFITSEEVAFNAGGISNPDELVIQNRMVALKNLDLDGLAFPDSAGTIMFEDSQPPANKNVTPAPAAFSATRRLRLNSTSKEGAYYQPTVYCACLPEDAVIIFATDPVTRRKIQQPGHTISVNEKRAATAFQRNKSQFEGLEEYDLSNLIVKEAVKHGYVSFGDIHLDRDRPADVLVWIWSEKWEEEKEYGFDLLQQQAGKSKGGFTVSLKSIWK